MKQILILLLLSWWNYSTINSIFDMKHSQRRNYHLLYESTQPHCIQFTVQIKELHQKVDIGLKSKTSTYIFSDAKNSHCEISKDLQWSVLQFHMNLYHELWAEHSTYIPK